MQTNKHTLLRTQHYETYERTNKENETRDMLE